MVHIVSSTGVEKDVSLDFDAICAYEDAHPDWSMVKELSNLKTMKFSSLKVLTSFFYEGGWPQFVGDGFTIDDLSNVILEGLNELGFIPKDSPSTE
ncbi:hypothetical protein PED39_05470 [Methanomassiliicoccales archaeon LGM-RCC1]|nr:hypothetical protein PED39_05470 [Methanomassiliicoccales archaeon LGM-RCC1]